MIQLINEDNMTCALPTRKAQVVFADYVYENKDFAWLMRWKDCLSEDGVLISMTDYHTSHLYRYVMEEILGATLINHLVWNREWGNFPKNRFHQTFDEIFIHSFSGKWNFDTSRIQIPKKTLTKGLNPSGRTTKTATAWIDDITLTTTAKERVRKKDGHLIRWQKPQDLYTRVLSPFLTSGSYILDIFMGSGSLGKWCKTNNYDYTGVELDREVFELAVENVDT
jgi:DNA modification methylase